MEEQEEDI
jgi:hypothetical protein